MLAVCTLGLGPGCIFTLTAIAKWECSSYGRALALYARDKKRKRIEILKEVFVTKNITVDGMHRNLIPPPKVVPIEGLVINEPESGIFFLNRNRDISLQRENVFKSNTSSRKSKNYLKTYSSVVMDNSWTLESRYVHEGRTIETSFYRDLSDDSVAKFTVIGFDCLLSLDEQICPSLNELEKTLEQIPPYNSRLSVINDIQNLIHQRTIHEKKIDNPSTLLTSSLGGCTSLEIDETKFYRMA
ncbi:hypothetical protein Tco_1568668 [Tanacetum coccineum]